jgi:Tol biopolymer transport system component
MKKIAFLTFLLYLFTGLHIHGQSSKINPIEESPYKIINPKPLTNKDSKFYYPRIAPDGKKVMASRYGESGIFIIDIETPDSIMKIKLENMSESGTKWLNNNEIFISRGVRTSGNRVKAIEHIRYDIYKKKVNERIQKNKLSKPNKTSNIELFYNKQTSKVHATDGQKSWVVTPEPGNYFKYVISPDQKKVIIHSLGNYRLCIYLLNGNGLINCIEMDGISQAWSPDSKYFLYYKTVDDGHVTTGSELYLATADGEEIWQLTDTQDAIEVRASWSEEKNIITYFDDKTKRIFVAELKQEMK